MDTDLKIVRDLANQKSGNPVVTQCEYSQIFVSRITEGRHLR